MVREHRGEAAIPNTSSSPLQPKDEAVLEIMKSRVRTFNPFRRNRIPEWNINIAYLCGFQDISFDGTNLHVNRQISPFSTTVNKILPAVRNDVAMGTKIPPKFDVVPDTTDENDKQTAIALGIRESGYLRRINNFDKQRGKIIIWYDIANIAWRKQYWDAKYKVVGNNPEPEEEGHNPELLPGEPIYQGEAVSEHTPTNELIWDWRQNNERLPWMIHAKPMTLAELLISYPTKALEIPASEFIQPNSSLNEFEIKVFNEFSQLTSPTGSSVEPDSSEMGEKDKQIMVYEMWQVMDTNYPLGVFSVMAGLDNGVVLQNDPYPIEQYPHGEVPFTAYDMMAPDKSVTGTASRISQARPLQRELNFIRRLILENTAALGSGVMYVNRDSNVNLKRIDNGTGLIIEYDGARPPVREAGQPVAGQLFLYVATIVQDINDIFSFPQVSQGKRPPGGPKSGVGIALLQEKADTQHSPTINEMDRADERAMNQLLSVAFANYDKRIFNIVGKDNEWTLFEFDPSSYTTKFNVVVRTGSSLPISKALERDMTLGLLERGLLGNPQDPTVKKRVLEHLDIGGLDRILKEKNKDVNFAKKEFQVPVQQYQQLVQQAGGTSEDILKQIYLPAVNPFDDHEIHVIEHKNDLLDKFFEYLGTGDPGMIIIANAMQDHWMQHSQILTEQQLRQAIMTGQIKREDLESSREKEKPKPSSKKE